jgi:hypothetical protein
VLAPVTICQTKVESREVFLGTAAAFATFLGDTRLIVSDGRNVAARKVIENGSVADLSFETILQPPSMEAIPFGVDEVWGAIRTEAAFTKGLQIALRCNRPQLATRKFPRTMTDGGLAYCVLTYDELESQCATRRAEAICELSARWFRNDEEKREDIERSACSFICLYLTARVGLQSWYHLEYDSLQHTSYVSVCDSVTKPVPVSKGACAFIGPETKRIVMVSWDDKTWSPLSSGFLIGPN